MKAFLDTSVYISHYRAGVHRELLNRLNTEYFLYLHAVVLAELHAGAGTPAFAKELVRLEKIFSSKGRIIVPEKRDYGMAGRMLRKMRQRGLIEDQKVSSFLGDSLLASSARHEGMTLVTEDKDFQRIAKVQPFPLLLVEPQFQ